MHMLMRRIRRVLCPAVILLLVFGLFSLTARAAAGTVYTCTINPCYAHPVTGKIEDAGGSSSTATGQGMVEGALSGSGILEVTDGGEYYLTVRMSLMDYSSGHSFQVQEVGGSGWSSVEASRTGSGSDDSGTTADMRIQVPSESCVVRCSMYVEPMGRDVIFYFYPSDYVVGNTTNMAAEIVTESSSGSQSGGQDSGSQGTSGDQNSFDDQNDSGNQESAGQSSASDQESASGKSGSGDSTGTGNNTVQSAAADGSASGSTSVSQSADSDLNNAQGLSLSTAPASAENESEASGSTSAGALTWILILTVSITLSGAILILLGAYLVYLFRRNWKRWGGAEVLLTEEDFDTDEKVYLADGFGLADESEGGIRDSEGVRWEEEIGRDPEEIRWEPEEGWHEK